MTARFSLVARPTGIGELHWHENVAATAVQRMLSDWIALTPLAIQASHLRGAPQATYTEAVGIRQATEIARLSPEVLPAAWDQELVTQHRRSTVRERWRRSIR